jgi:hypothetical protein
MAALFENLAFVWWIKAFVKPEENPIVRWWVEHDFPWDFLAFLDDSPFFKGTPIGENDVLLAWMSIGAVQNGIEPKEAFLKRYKKEIPPVSRKRKVFGLILLPIVALGSLYAFTVTNDSILLISIVEPILAAIIIAAYGYHELYYRLKCGRVVSKWSPSAGYFLVPFITAAFIFGVPMLISFAIPGHMYYIVVSGYPMVIRMLLNATAFVITVLGMLLVFEIYVRMSLKLIREKLGM